MIKVLFVCLGNICRSPTAHSVFRQRVDEAGLSHLIKIDSAGTGDWHIGKAPDKRATKTAEERGYVMKDLRARQVSAKDFSEFDYVLAMDAQNLRDLEAMRPNNFAGHLSLFLDFSQHNVSQDVPDPYYGGDEGFLDVLSMVEECSDQLLKSISSSPKFTSLSNSQN
ncbi:low molecular weight protein-tyrosine-phosphatase [Aurantivibrio infirmus]